MLLVAMNVNATTSGVIINGDSVASTGGGGGAIIRQKEDEKKTQLVIIDINLQIAVFRDLLIHVGTAKDSAELRERIRRVRRQCVEGCKQTNAQLLPQIKSALSEGTILDNHQLICLYMLSQLLERELDKCLRLVVAIPMDMSSIYDNKPTAHGLGSVLSQIVICKSMKPDFNVEEKISIEKDRREIRQIIDEMAECLPKEDPEKARNGLTSAEGSKRSWIFKRKRKSSSVNAKSLAPRGCAVNGMSSSFCCLCSHSPNMV
eukprot:maker-scaffold268_size230776-snap-gene-1.26 protein:Tk11098 transcript:maker-scaffold268_size230776-snap-gene-1.26-mRNA-1 annotation:"conserved hypothetical protein"